MDSWVITKIRVTPLCIFRMISLVVLVDQLLDQVLPYMY